MEYGNSCNFDKSLNSLEGKKLVISMEILNCQILWIPNSPIRHTEKACKNVQYKFS